MDKSGDAQYQNNQSREEIEEALKRLIEQNEALKKRNDNLHRQISGTDSVKSTGEAKKAPKVIKDRRPEGAPAVRMEKRQEAPERKMKVTPERMIKTVPENKEQENREVQSTRIIPQVKEPVQPETVTERANQETQVINSENFEIPEFRKPANPPAPPVRKPPVRKAVNQTVEKPKKRTARKIVKGILIAIVTVAVISLICGLFAKKPDLNLFGGRFYTVENDGMAPEITIKDVVFVKKVPVSDLKEGDTILVKKDGRHFYAYDSLMRIDGDYILNVHDRDNCYEIKENDLVGKAVMKLRLGRISRYAIIHTYNYYAMLLASALVCLGLLFLIPGMGENRKKKKKGQAKPKKTKKK